MSAFRGKCGKGARARHKADLRSQAEERDAKLGEHDPKRRQVRLAIEALERGLEAAS